MSSNGRAGNPWVRGQKVPAAGLARDTGASSGRSLDAAATGSAVSLSASSGSSGGLTPGSGIPSWDGPPVPHLGGAEQRPAAQEAARAGWWWLGVHGGAGVSTLVSFLPGGLDAYRRWPAPQLHPGPGAVILVCRTHVHGLSRAREAVIQWQAGDVPEGLLLAGLVAVADAPGRLPRRQAEVLRLLAGAVPRTWTVPWLDELRVADVPAVLPLPPPLVRLSLDLEALRHRYGSIW